MKKSKNDSLSNFSEYKVDNLEDIVGGDVNIPVIFSGMLESSKSRNDVKIETAKS